MSNGARKITERDSVVWALLADPNWKVTADGRVLTKVPVRGRLGTLKQWRRAGWVSPSRKGTKLYRRIQYHGVEIYEHRVIYAFRKGTLCPFKTVDHPNLNGLDNKQELRQLTDVENVRQARAVYKRHGVTAAQFKRNWINGAQGMGWRGIK